MRNRLYNYTLLLSGFILFFSIARTQQPTMVITAAEGLDGFSSRDATLSLTFTSSAATNDFTENDITVSNGVISDFLSLSTAHLSFDGVDDYVKVVREVQDDFTLQAWVKTTTSRPGDFPWNGLPIIYADYPGFPDLDFCTAVLNGKFSFNTGPSDRTIQSTTSIDDGQWHHVVATREKSTGTNSVYVDGVLEETLISGNTESLTLPSHIYIGGQRPSNNNKFFKGEIKEVAVWTSKISSDGVAALYNSGTPLNALADAGNYTSSGSLQGYWKLNDGSGSTAKDESTSNNDGVVNGGASWVGSGNINVFTATLTPIAHGWVDIDVLANTFTDNNGNNNTAAEQFNWFYDILGPDVVFSPPNGSFDVAVNTNVTLTFNEPIRHVNDLEITNSNVDALLRLKTPIHSGTDISFDATIDADKKVITIDPSSNFDYAQTIWVGIGESVEDTVNNGILSAAAWFTTIDTNRAPVLHTIGNQTTFEDVAKSLVLSASDADGERITFSASSSDANVAVTISDSLLTMDSGLNWHGATNITVTATDTGPNNLTDAETFTLTVVPVNDAPTAITLSPDSVNENQSTGILVGRFTSADVDTGESFTYHLVSGDGVNDKDNDKFVIVNDSLLTNAVFDYETNDTLFIRVLTQDIGGLTHTENLLVKVIDTPDPLIAFSSAILMFGDVIVTRTNKKPMTLNSTGTDTVVIDSVTVTGKGFALTDRTYPVKVAPGLSTDFEFSFSPDTLGQFTGSALFHVEHVLGLKQLQLEGVGVNDTIPPVITHTMTPINSDENQNVTITVPVTDENQITDVTLYYRLGGDPQTYNQSGTSNGDGTYSATINGSNIGINGLAYYHTATDEYNNIRMGDTLSVKVQY